MSADKWNNSLQKRMVLLQFYNESDRWISHFWQIPYLFNKVSIAAIQPSCQHWCVTTNIGQDLLAEASFSRLI